MKRETVQAVSTVVPMNDPDLPKGITSSTKKELLTTTPDHELYTKQSDDHKEPDIHQVIPKAAANPNTPPTLKSLNLPLWDLFEPEPWVFES